MRPSPGDTARIREFVEGEILKPLLQSEAQRLGLLRVQDGPGEDFTGPEEVIPRDQAPPAGWAESGWVSLTEGHSYYVWTRDNHYGKFYVKHVEPAYVVVDWAYQIDQGNPELVKQKLARRSGGSTGPATLAESVESGGVAK